MQNISKRALSWLCVVAMVLSMVPVFDLAGFAIKASAAEEVTAGQANLPEGTQAIIDAAKKIQDADLAAHIAAQTCPVCGSEGVDWKTKTNNSGSWDIGIAATDTSYHFYFDGNNANAETGLIYSSHYNFAQTKAEGQTLCIAMINNPTVDLDGYIRNSKANCEINIMGQGTIKSDGKKADGVTDASEDLGLILLQGGNSTINIYGGTYIYTGEGDGTTNDACPDSGVISMRSAGNVLNIFDGVTMGPETQDTTKHLYNIVLTKGTINMYGGLIRNGVTGYTAASGNVNIASGTIFNMYGGTIQNGSAVDNDYAQPYLTKAGATGTAIPSIGGNVRVSGGTFNMYGGSLEGGYANNGGNGGGNLGTLANGTATILGGTVKGGTTKGSGDNINVVSGTVTIGGSALIESGEEGGHSSIYLSKDATAAKLVVNGGTIRGGTGVQGGNINAGAKTTLEINGGLIENGTATTGAGGNININAGCTVTLGEGTVIQNGVAGSYGGNVHGGESFTTSAKVLNGTARQGGGNINVAGGKTVTVAGGVVANGWVTGVWNEENGTYVPSGAHWGGNIRAWTAGVTVTGGLIYGGVHGPNKSAHGSNNIGCLASIEKTGTANVAGSTLEISGGIIVGDIATTAPTQNTAGTFSCPGTTVTLSGSPKIVKSYKLEDGTVVTASSNGLYLPGVANIAGLSTDAQICVGVTKGKVFTEATENAQTLVNCFTAYNSALVAAANADNQLVLQDAPEPEIGVFAPEKFGGMAYCDACLAQGKSEEDALVEWTAYNGENSSEANRREEYIDGKVNYGAHFHLYLAEDKTYDTNNFFVTYRNACINLNGHSITAGANGGATFSVTKNLSVFDSEGGAVVTGNGKSTNSGATFHANGAGGAANYRIYGGTYTKLEGNTISPLVHIGGNGGTIQLYGGQIGTGDEVYGGVPAVYLQGSKRDQDANGNNYTYDGPAAFILHDGKIYGGTHEDKVGGAIRVGSTGTSGDGIKETNYDGVATLTIKGGEIIGGSASYGGAIWVGKSNTLIIEGGKIHNGTASGNGGNIHVEAGCALTISGGEIYGGQSTKNGGNININGGTLTISGDAKIYNGIAGATGGNINTSAATTISGDVLIDNGEAKGNGGGNVHYSKALNINGGTIQNGKATAEKGASGGNLRGNGTLTMTAGTVRNGYAAESATGGGNLYATSGQTVTISGGNWIGGEAYNGGNIYIYNGNLTVSGDTVIEGGKATNHGGNIYKYGGDAGYGNTNTHYIAISGNVVIKDGEAGANGGNICLSASKLSIADNAQVLGGYAKTFGGNIYVSGSSRKGAAIPDTDPVKYEYYYEYAVFEMKGGIVKDGTASGMANANIYIQYANMDMSGGEIYAPANSTANGAGLRLAASAALYLSGDATIGCQDGVNDNCFQIQPASKLYISGDWTGNACVQFNEYFSAGETIVTDEKYYATWGTFTSAADENGLVTYTFNQGEGEAYTGTLIHERAPYPTIVPQADGTTAIVAAGVISGSGATWYASSAEALENYDIDEDLYIYLSGDVTIAEDIVIDVAGAELNLSGTGWVYGLDSRNDGYGAYGTITIAEGADIDFCSDNFHPVNNYRYIAIKEGNALSFHRIELYFTNATLRAEDAGIYYKATFKTDEILASRVECFGTVLSLDDMPDGGFEYDEGINIATKLDGEKFVMDDSGKLDITTASVFGIVKESRSKEQNTAYAQMDIYANLYVKILYEEGSSTFVMAEESGVDATKGAGVAYSLVDILALINDNWDNYSDEEKAIVQEALNKWAAYITDEAAAGLQTQLDKIFPAA